MDGGVDVVDENEEKEEEGAVSSGLVLCVASVSISQLITVLVVSNVVVFSERGQFLFKMGLVSVVVDDDEDKDEEEEDSVSDSEIEQNKNRQQNLKHVMTISVVMGYGMKQKYKIESDKIKKETCR